MTIDTNMTDAQWAAFLATPKRCTRCDVLKTVADFPFTSERGRQVVRSRCDVCMKAYYAARQQRKKMERFHLEGRAV